MKRDNEMAMNELDRFGRLIIIMEDWAEWNAQYSGIRNPSHSVGLTSGYAASQSFDDMLHSVENNIAAIVETAVDDLQPANRAAINKRYGLSAVFRFPRGNYADLLLEAHESLMLTLPKKGVVI